MSRSSGFSASPRSASAAPAPCRRSGRCPVRRGRSRDASGRSTGARPAPPAAADRCRGEITRRIGDEALAAFRAAEKVSRDPHARRDAGAVAGSTSCRKPDRAPDRPPAARALAVPLVRRVRYLCHGADVESAAATIKRGSTPARRLSWSAVRRKERGRAACRSSSLCRGCPRPRGFQPWLRP